MNGPSSAVLASQSNRENSLSLLLPGGVAFIGLIAAFVPLIGALVCLAAVAVTGVVARRHVREIKAEEITVLAELERRVVTEGFSPNDALVLKMHEDIVLTYRGARFWHKAPLRVSIFSLAISVLILPVTLPVTLSLLEHRSTQESQPANPAVPAIPGMEELDDPKDVEFVETVYGDATLILYEEAPAGEVIELGKERVCGDLNSGVPPGNVQNSITASGDTSINPIGMIYAAAGRVIPEAIRTYCQNYEYVNDVNAGVTIPGLNGLNSKDVKFVRQMYNDVWDLRGPYEDMPTAGDIVELGKGVCDDLRAGKDPSAIRDLLLNEDVPGYVHEEFTQAAARVVTQSVNMYCPGYNDKLNL